MRNMESLALITHFSPAKPSSWRTLEGKKWEKISYLVFQSSDLTELPSLFIMQQKQLLDLFHHLFFSFFWISMCYRIIHGRDNTFGSWGRLLVFFSVFSSEVQTNVRPYIYTDI